MEVKSFRTYLQQELVTRCKKNPSYSLRAFARSLEIEASGLSQILRGKRKLSVKMTKRLAQKLDFSLEEIQHFEEVKCGGNSAGFKTLEIELFEVLSDWYYFAILELMNVKSFKNDPKWIAKALGITVSEVHIGIDRLEKLGMLEIDDEGSWTDLTGGKTNMGDPHLTTSALIRHQKKLLELSSKSLSSDPLSTRDHTGTMMAIDSSKIPEAKKLIHDFRRKLGKLLTAKNEDQVYQLQISLFPLTHIEEDSK